MGRCVRSLASLVPVALLAALGPLPILDPPPEGSPPPQGSPPPPGYPSSDGFPEVGEPRFEDVGWPGDVAALWGSVDCERVARVRQGWTGGDPHVRADGEPQGADGFRRLRVRDGDDFYGERCELGRNDHRDSPVAVYHEGERLITFASFRLRAGFPLRRDLWQAVMQMKQSQPSNAGGGTPVLALHASDGRWRLRHTGWAGPDLRHGSVWSARARARTWVRFAFDVVYSANPSVGSVQIHTDLNGDGDALDDGELSRRLRLQTLKRETAGSSSDGLSSGDSIPSHLRIGIYHDDSYRCRRHRCSIDIDNVGVYTAARPPE
jgi:hypothetical protein